MPREENWFSGTYMNCSSILLDLSVRTRLILFFLLFYIVIYENLIRPWESILTHRKDSENRTLTLSTFTIEDVVFVSQLILDHIGLDLIQKMIHDLYYTLSLLTIQLYHEGFRTKQIYRTKPGDCSTKKKETEI